MIKTHPAAESFPLMDADRYAELVADIKKNGQIEAITLCDGMILDGRNRYKACLELGIEPKTKNFVGDPWAFVWSLNGERRDLVAEQRYLIWKFCSENSEAFQAEKRQIQEEANRKRSEAMQGVPYAAKGESRKDAEKVVGQNDPLPSKEHKAREAKATASKTNIGAVKRGDTLAKARPDLAEQVRKGEKKPAEAYREMKREEIISHLEEIKRQEAIQPTGLYDVIVADPPWPIEKIERDERPNQSEFDYPVMSVEEIAAIKLPMADDCHVFLWTTQKYLPAAFEIFKAWGIKYVYTHVWHKPGGFSPFLLPQYNCEFCLYGRKGSPKFIDTKNFFTCFEAPRGKHSEKPEEFYEMLRRVTGGRRLDMFNRRKIYGFDGHGNEAKLASR